MKGLTVLSDDLTGAMETGLYSFEKRDVGKSNIRP